MSQICDLIGLAIHFACMFLPGLSILSRNVGGSDDLNNAYLAKNQNLYFYGTSKARSNILDEHKIMARKYIIKFYNSNLLSSPTHIKRTKINELTRYGHFLLPYVLVSFFYYSF